MSINHVARNATDSNDAASARRAALDGIDRARIEPDVPKGAKRGAVVLPGLSGSQGTVARVLAASMGADGWGWLGIVKITLRSKLGQRTVETAMRELVAKGWLTLGKHRTPKGGEVRAYRVTPVENDLLTDADIATMEADYREATRARQDALRSRRAGSTSRQTVPRQAAHDGDVSRQGLPLCRGTSCRSVTASAAADALDLGALKDAVCEQAPPASNDTTHTTAAPSPAAHTQPLALPPQQAPAPTPLAAATDDVTIMRGVVHAMLTESLPHLTRDAHDIADAAIAVEATPAMVVTAIRSVRFKEGPTAKRSKLVSYIDNQHHLDDARDVNDMLRARGLLPPRVEAPRRVDNVPPPAPPPNPAVEAAKRREELRLRGQRDSNDTTPGQPPRQVPAAVTAFLAAADMRAAQR